jgi:hypothetical protein
MATITNTRIAQLPVITSTELADTDLIIVSDISAGFTKKMEASEYRVYALSASVSVPTSSLSVSSSFATTARNSISSSYSLTSSFLNSGATSSFAITSSNAITASWALGLLGGSSTTSASYALTSSYAITSSQANLAAQAYVLIYNGTDNGTAFNAITSSYARTASYVAIGGNILATSSWATNALISDVALTATTATSADTATVASRVANFYALYGPWTGGLEYTLSTTESYIRASASIKANDGYDYAETIFYCTGTVTSSFTSSAADQSARYVYLGIKDWTTEVVTELDRQYFDFRPYNHDNGNISGSMMSGFNLTGISGSATGSYKVFVSASKGVDIDLNRKPIFTISSKARSVTIEDFPFV